jgi:hypothetical protein
MKTKDYINANRPALFDWLVLMGTFSLSFAFPTLGSVAFTGTFSWIMFAGLLMYGTGAWLKHLPLYYRMLRTGTKPRDIPYLLFVVIGHWIIIYTVILLSAEAAGKIAGPSIVKSGTTSSGVYYMIGLVLSVFLTWLVFHHKTRLKPEEHYSENYLFYRELAGDILLLISVTLFTFIFWEKGIMSLFVKGLPTGAGEIAFTFLLLAICFVLFYLPLRYLFLVEDHSSRRTWQRFLLIFGFLLIRSLFILLEKS